MNDIQEVWVNAVLMPTGEIICEGRCIGYLTAAKNRKNGIGSHNVRKCSEYSLIARTVGVHERDKKA